MRVGVLRETAPGETRVALVPEAVGRLVQSGWDVHVEPGAGAAAHYPDSAYSAVGAHLTPAEPLLAEADLVLKVQRPSPGEVRQMKPGSTFIGFLQPMWNLDLLAQLAERQITALAMELVPRITRAQSMDALSSQATVAGYKAALVGASMLDRLLPMMMTAAGTLVPAKVLVLGAGVAGLQAVATARRLGGVVTAFDVRPVVKEQVQSLGARFLELPQVNAEGSGGYAKELAEDQQRRVQELIAGAVRETDLVISTALIPGRRAPLLMTAEAVAGMKPGAVIIDLAAETGGNCALTRPDETVEISDVRIAGPTNLPATVAQHASQMYSRNLQSLIQHLRRDGGLAIESSDEIAAVMVVTADGEVRFGAPQRAAEAQKK